MRVQPQPPAGVRLRLAGPGHPSLSREGGEQASTLKRRLTANLSPFYDTSFSGWHVERRVSVL